MENKLHSSQGEEIKRRRYSRVEVNCKAMLLVDNKKYKPEKIFNLGLGGVCMLYKSDLSPGDKCDFEIIDAASGTYTYKARVAWKTEDRLALEFVDMDSDSYFFLQTTVLYHADDPLNVAEEFEEDFPSCR